MVSPKTKTTSLVSAKDLAAAFDHGAWAEKYPPVLSLAQAAELLQVPLNTLYQWRSRGLMRGCSRKVGKHVRVWRDHLIQQIFDGGFDGPQ